MSGPDIIFYDGHCGLCHRWVRHAVARDTAGRFRFAPLQGEEIARRLSAEQRAGLPDSVVILTGAGRLMLRSDAVLHVLEELGGAGSSWAKVGRALPRPLRDAAYDLVAVVRRWLFRRPKDVCPTVPPNLRNRFLP